MSIEVYKLRREIRDLKIEKENLKNELENLRAKTEEEERPDTPLISDFLCYRGLSFDRNCDGNHITQVNSQYRMNLDKTTVIVRRVLNNHTEKCTICGQDVEYLEHMRVQHQINKPFSTALRNLQRRIQDLEKEVAERHGH